MFSAYDEKFTVHCEVTGEPLMKGTMDTGEVMADLVKFINTHNFKSKYTKLEVCIHRQHVNHEAILVRGSVGWMQQLPISGSSEIRQSLTDEMAMMNNDERYEHIMAEFGE